MFLNQTRAAVVKEKKYIFKSQTRLRKKKKKNMNEVNNTCYLFSLEN